LVRKPEERVYFKNLGVDGMILILTFRGVGWSMEWIDLAQDRDKWRDFVNVAMKNRIS
jgi:hypothetical protein